MGNDVYEETFESPFGCQTKSGAVYVLNEIRRTHSAKDGWVELDSGVEQDSNGRWHAWRHHKKDPSLATTE